MSQAAEYSYSYFIDRGYSPEAAAAIVGNFDHESGFNTKAVHDKNTGFGIAGWRDPPGEKNGRRTQLLRFASNNKLNPNSLGTQLQFADYELRTTENKAGKLLRSAKTVEQANDAMMHYERPKGYSADNPQAGHGYSSRLAKARSALGSYAGDYGAPNSDMPAGPDERAGNDSQFVDNTDTEAIPTHDMAWNENSAEKSASALADKPTMGSRLKSGIKGLLSSMGSGSRDQGPFDYTPAGESNLDVNYNPDEGGVPLDNYRHYANYARGGNVEQDSISPRDWFAMYEGEG